MKESNYTPKRFRLLITKYSAFLISLISGFATIGTLFIATGRFFSIDSENMYIILILAISFGAIIYGIYYLVYSKNDISYDIEDIDIGELINEKYKRKPIKHSISINHPTTEKEHKQESINIVDSYIQESNNIAERIYASSKTYLFVGLIIALFGIIFFIVYQPQQTIESSQPIYQHLFNYLPKFGALFFIEFIAFFFLKQYRIHLEEYRYYESIKRDRQHKKMILEIVELYKDNPDALKLLINYMSDHNIKIPEITGDNRVETEKALYKDMDVISKFAEFMKVRHKE